MFPKLVLLVLFRLLRSDEINNFESEEPRRESFGVCRGRSSRFVTSFWSTLALVTRGPSNTIAAFKGLGRILAIHQNCHPSNSKGTTGCFPSSRVRTNLIGGTLASYIPETFNDKPVQPIVTGDFSEFWELWASKPYIGGNGGQVMDLYLIKSKHRHRAYEGVKVDTIPLYGSDLRFIPIPEKDILIMSNSQELDIYTLWGKKRIESQPSSKYKYQFVYKNWLFINESMVIDLDYAIKSGPPFNERTLMRPYNAIPWSTLEKSVLDYVAKHCFTLDHHCSIDPDDGRLLMSSTEVVVYRNGLKLSVLKADYSFLTPKHHFYMLEDDITDLSFYIPNHLETFVKPSNFQYNKRYMIFPNFKPADRFITTRRHQIFVHNNRAQFQRHLPTPAPCSCEKSTTPEPELYLEEPPSTSSQMSLSVVALVALIKIWL